ncbi:MAG: HPr kinase/phosphorylase, partial [Rhodoferax sp.]|nr:HPr kinase/phosphorylase [Rhodoferax sp.]
RAIFGETAVRRKMRLKLIVHLVRRETMEREYERIPSEPLTQDVLGVPVRKVVIQVVAGRNIAVLVEAAVRNTILQLRGIDTYREFVERQRRAMEG